MRFGLKVPFVAMFIVGLAVASPTVALPILVFGSLACAILYSPSKNWLMFILQTIYLILLAWAAVCVIIWLVVSAGSPNAR